MSADNWTTCPKCLAEAMRAADAEREAVMALYGSIPVDEFDAKRAALTTVDAETYCTLREDYEFYGAGEGEICWAYTCRCTTCGLGTNVKGARRFYGEAQS